MPLVSMVIPTLKEELRAPLESLGAHLSGLGAYSFEILVVDDSAADVRAAGRAAIQESSLPANVSARLVDGPRSGKGAAVRMGIASTRGEVVFLLDVDLPAPIALVEEFLRRIDQGADVVIAERVLDREFSSPIRWVVSRGLLFIQRALVFHSREFSDTQCGFKAFRGDLIRSIASRQIVAGGMYDLEYLYAAHVMGKRIEKVRIQPLPETRESRINVWKCLRQDPLDVLRIKANGVVRGRYLSASPSLRVGDDVAGR